MRMIVWAVLGSLFVNLTLGLLIASVSATPRAQQTYIVRCSGEHGAQKAPSSEHSPVWHYDYLAAVRMGWAPG